ncbi:MAG TPA: hypothetical protein VN428_07090 [Bryobacteraceae bacterium]|nr:hypothetical protein [Bryobacteraceae bacterium]
MKRIIVGLCALILLSTVAAFAADVSGVWKAAVPGRGGETREVTFTFKVDGEKLTGTMSGGQGGDVELQDGKVAGDAVTFKVKREFNGNSVVMLYEGKVEASEIKFKSTREGSDRPPREFTAKR